MKKALATAVLLEVVYSLNPYVAQAAGTISSTNYPLCQVEGCELAEQGADT